MLTWVRRLEDALLVLLLSAMIGVAAAQVFLRNFFDSGLYWGDSAVRVMVLWVAMIGAMLATSIGALINLPIAVPGGLRAGMVFCLEYGTPKS